ncbi:MAG TPA: phosphate signaling complex protein PhoU [Anaerolineae bacterium]|nr:phosphate signaling complex protein PhoU [Anaerolineae bacterium]
MTTRTLLDKELNKLREHLLHIESMVQSAIERAIRALKEQDGQLAQQIINDDEGINKLRYKVEKLGVTTIATQQPMASDLRMIISAMHVAVELERMGDHAAGIAHIAIELCNEPLLKPLIDIPRMAEIAQGMLRDSIQAFMDDNADAARAIATRDDEIDQLYDQILRELLTYMIEDPRNIRRATYLLWVAHALERIGDRVTNISERVLFMETGKFKED